MAVIVIVAIIARPGGGDSGDVSAGDGGVSAGDSGSSTDATRATPAQITEGQKALAVVGCYTGSIDGKYGPRTEQSIRDFQSASGLKVDAIFGPATLAALQDAVAAGKVVCTPLTADPILEDAASPAGGTVKRLVVPGPQTSVLLACDQEGFQPFFFTDQGVWVGCEAIVGTKPGPESDLSGPTLGDVESPAGGMVKELTIPGPQTSVQVRCAGNGLTPFLFQDQPSLSDCWLLLCGVG